jgi:hypothetical protein
MEVSRDIKRDRVGDRGSQWRPRAATRTGKRNSSFVSRANPIL